MFNVFLDSFHTHVVVKLAGLSAFLSYLIESLVFAQQAKEQLFVNLSMAAIQHDSAQLYCVKSNFLSTSKSSYSNYYYFES